MSAADRSAGRDVHIYDAIDRTIVLGGLILTNGVINANFYSMVEFFVIFNSDCVLQHEDGSFVVNNEIPLLRTISLNSETRVAAFCDTVRERDRQCVITGRPVLDAEYGFWTGFEAAHIFPLAYKAHWTEHNYGCWITILLAIKSVGSINLMQNGILLDNTIYALFDHYFVSINLDDNYKIVCFRHDGHGITGRRLDQQFLQDPRHPVDSLLRWHFRQAVLVNMKGAGEAFFECDFPPGSDMMGEIMSGPRAGARMEFELFSRLAAH